MPSQTAGYKLPYPVGTDRVADGDDAMRRLAQSVENMVQTAIITIPITAVNTGATFVWVFPVPYLSPPVVSVTLYSVSAGNLGAHFFGVTVPPLTTQATIGGFRTSGASTFQVMVMAVGPVNAVA